MAGIYAGEILVENYEILVMAPVKSFGYTSMTQLMEENGITDYKLVENSKRFGVGERWRRLRNFGTRSMNADGIIYPCWENRARAYEDVSTLILVLELLVLLYPAGWVLWLGICVYRRRKVIKACVRNKAGNLWGDILFPKIKKLYKDAYKSSKFRKNKVE